MLQQLAQDPSWTAIHYATPATRASVNVDTQSQLQRQGVVFHSLPLNHSAKIEALLDTIGKQNSLAMVIFDRFYAEEAFSFHIRKHCPHAIRVVDMQDMHSLRRGRQALVKRWTAQHHKNTDPLACLDDSKAFRPTQNDPLLLRELASLHRSDLALVCSNHEYDLLQQVYQIPTCKLQLASFWVHPESFTVNTTAINSLLLFEEREDFVFLGGFRHEPNVDAVHLLLRHVWPRIAQALPEARLHIYGAAPPSSMMQRLEYKNNSSCLRIHGHVASLDTALGDKRVLLAPLRYGAGCKGKIVDAWVHRVPVVTTCIGSEGMMIRNDGDENDDNKKQWGGSVAVNLDDFVDKAIQLYSNRRTWERAVVQGERLVQSLFPFCHWKSVSDKLKHVVENRDEHRCKDHVGPMLWRENARSTEYFSRWIECKERLKGHHHSSTDESR